MSGMGETDPELEQPARLLKRAVQQDWIGTCWCFG